MDLLVAGHHGSKYATSETLLAAVDPDAVAISVGYNNYGHPTPETLGRIQAQGGGGLPHRLRGAHHLHSPQRGGGIINPMAKRTTRPPDRRHTEN